MRSNTIKAFWTISPMLFPWTALFHVVILLSAVYTLYPIPVSQKDWLRPLGMLVFTVLSFFLCYLKKKAAMSYIFLTMASVLAYLYCPDDSSGKIISSAFMPFNWFLSFFILVYYRRFNK